MLIRQPENRIKAGAAQDISRNRSLAVHKRSRSLPACRSFGPSLHVICAQGDLN